MFNFLLEVTTKMTEISDLITDKWLEILGWLSIPTIGTALIVGLIKIIVTCIQRKINKKSIKPLTDEVRAVKDEFKNTVEDLKLTMNGKFDEYSASVERNIENGLNAYEKAKNDAYNKIIEQDENIKTLIGKIEPVKVEVEKYKEEAEEKVGEIIDKLEEIKEVDFGEEFKQDAVELIENVSCETIKKVKKDDDGIFER